MLAYDIRPSVGRGADGGLLLDRLVAIGGHVAADDAADHGTNRGRGDTPVTLAELVPNDTASDRADGLANHSISDVVLDGWLLVVARRWLIDGDFAVDDTLAIHDLRLLIYDPGRLIDDLRRGIDDLGLGVGVLNDNVSPVFAVPVIAVIVMVPTAIREGICAEDGCCYNCG